MNCYQCKESAIQIENNLRECEAGHRTGVIKMNPIEYKTWTKLKRQRRIILRATGESYKIQTVYELPTAQVG